MMLQKSESFSCKKENYDKINIKRFITKLDSFFATDDLEGAKNHIEYWEKEAQNIGDDTGLVTILNEELGFYRRNGQKEAGLSAVERVIPLLEKVGNDNTLSGAAVMINAATTLKAFGNAERAIHLYARAEKVFVSNEKIDIFEYAALLNNKASALCDTKDYLNAQFCYQKAIEILNRLKKYDGEIAVSYVNLAHLIHDWKGDKKAVDDYLALAWDYINSDKQPHDANYAFILSKCAPSYRFFGKELEADALEEVSKEIYGAGK